MRSWRTALLAICLVGLSAGCHHTAGVCDCTWSDPCCPYPHLPGCCAGRLPSSYHELPPPPGFVPHPGSITVPASYPGWR